MSYRLQRMVIIFTENYLYLINKYYIKLFIVIIIIIVWNVKTGKIYLSINILWNVNVTKGINLAKIRKNALDVFNIMDSVFYNVLRKLNQMIYHLYANIKIS